MVSSVNHWHGYSLEQALWDDINFYYFVTCIRWLQMIKPGRIRGKMSQTRHCFVSCLWLRNVFMTRTHRVLSCWMAVSKWRLDNWKTLKPRFKYSGQIEIWLRDNNDKFQSTTSKKTGLVEMKIKMEGKGALDSNLEDMYKVFKTMSVVQGHLIQAWICDYGRHVVPLLFSLRSKIGPKLCPFVIPESLIIPQTLRLFIFYLPTGFMRLSLRQIYGCIQNLIELVCLFFP